MSGDEKHYFDGIRDADWARQVKRELVCVLAERERHSLSANLIGWAICTCIAAAAGLMPALIAALVLRLAAIGLTRWSCAKLRTALANRQPYEPAFRQARIILSTSGLSWAMLTWPVIDGTMTGAPAFAMLTLVTVGVCLICSLVGLIPAVLLGFAFTFVLSVILGGFAAGGTPDFIVCGTIILPLVGAVSFGLGTRRQAVQAAEDAIDNMYLRDELASSLHHAEFLSRHDPLTGLLNRRAIFDDLDSDGGTHGIIALDLDRFKAINDTYGHKAGDEVLIAVSQVLKEASRSCALGRCLAARMGGEEFLILVLTEDLDRVLDFAEYLRAQIEKAFPLPTLPALRCTTSVGVALWYDSTTLDSAMQQADEALYRAKHSGRNRVVAAHCRQEAA